MPKKQNNMFTGSSPAGYRAEIRKAKDGYSLFTWFDSDKTGLLMWRESHGLTWFDAFTRACEHLKTEKAGA